MRWIKLDSAVDVRCDFCSRTGRRGYIVQGLEGYDGVEIFCPACFTFLYGEGGWKPGEAWEEFEVKWLSDRERKALNDLLYWPDDKNER